MLSQNYKKNNYRNLLGHFCCVDELLAFGLDYIYDGLLELRAGSFDGHLKCLKAAFRSAKKRIVIVSPFISIKAIEADNLLEKILSVTSKDVDVLVYTDKNLDVHSGKLKTASKLGREKLMEAGAQVKILNKAIVMDETVLVEGSFNWLSAVRDKTNPYYRLEVSQII